MKPFATAHQTHPVAFPPSAEAVVPFGPSTEAAECGVAVVATVGMAWDDGHREESFCSSETFPLLEAFPELTEAIPLGEEAFLIFEGLEDV